MIKILFLGAEPKNENRLRLGDEVKAIRTRLQMARERSQFELHERWAVKPSDLIQYMEDVQPTIVHFSGHGAGAPGLCFENEQGNTQLVTADQLKAFFAPFRDRVRCVVLNACYAGEQAKAIVEHIPFVVGMKKTVDDRSSTAFSSGFYIGLGGGETVGMAFELGKSQIAVEGLPDADVPVMLVKPGVNEKIRINEQEKEKTMENVDRKGLISVLENLGRPDLDSVINTLKGASRRDRPMLSAPERVFSLIGYAESSIGPGLKAVADIVIEIDPESKSKIFP